MRQGNCSRHTPCAVGRRCHALCGVGRLRHTACAYYFALALLAVLAVGCGRQPPEAASSVSSVPVVRVVKPELRNLTCTVDLPGFVNAFEQTAIYAKVSGFIQRYYVDIGDHVKKDAPVADIFVPELVEEHGQKVAMVKLDRSMVHVAESKVQTAIAQLAEAKANVGKYQADIVRWQSEVQRLTQMVAQRVVDRDVLDETQKQLSSSQSARRRPGGGEIAGGRSGVRRGRPASGQGPGERGRGRGAPHRGHAGVYQGDRPLRRRGDRSQRQHRRLCGSGCRRQVHGSRFAHVCHRSGRPGANLRRRSRGLCRAMCAWEPRPTCVPTR